ncbi:MAG: hypothetical protein MUP55_03765 [Candidatus Aenigmarchaeota archaeon]|nr:hypothetical protein [Candidatus Aenigmarchaeota archaeon]
MEKVLHVKKIGNDYQVFNPTGLEKPAWAGTEEGCALAIIEYRQKHSDILVKFDNVYKLDEMKIRRIARI